MLGCISPACVIAEPCDEVWFYDVLAECRISQNRPSSAARPESVPGSFRDWCGRTPYLSFLVAEPCATEAWRGEKKPGKPGATGFVTSGAREDTCHRRIYAVAGRQSVNSSRTNREYATPGYFENGTEWGRTRLDESLFRAIDRTRWDEGRTDLVRCR